MTEQIPNDPQLETFTRTQILMGMGVTAIVLFGIAKLWLYFGNVTRLGWDWDAVAIAAGVGLGLAISATSSVVYRLWPGYRRCADFYLQIVLEPLVWPDLVWLGLLPGLSEELLFRGVMLPAIGLNAVGLILSSLCFGVLHLSGLQQWPYMVWATIVGMILGGSALVTGNLFVPITAHIVTNLISSVLWKLGKTGTEGRSLD
ncbi:CPBP family intramembrane metalloprotease [Laspinema sp. D1]|uniref:CPBP family intramembrane glutamic endopeptidase n=1 Tax=Laspinema palackyanum TaxID=3231601 RepID=UPI0034907B17|nr:CPBP family intramembrane metalloprotease [Laspinema sp. D2b]